MQRQYLVQLVGSCDDMPVAIFTNRDAVLTFLSENPPRPVDGEGARTNGPLAEAMKVQGRGPSVVFGWQVTVFYGDGVRFVPQECHQLQWQPDGSWPTDSEWSHWTSQERLAFLSSLTNDPF